MTLMKNVIKYISAALLMLAFLSACGDGSKIKISGTLKQNVRVFPDYRDVTIPYNIAPLNFSMLDYKDACLEVKGKSSSFEIKADDGCFKFSESRWKEMMEESKGGSITLTVCLQKNGQWFSTLPFKINVAADPVDPWISYRLIPPGYELWNTMGIYQRNIESFEQRPIYENTLTNGNCLNCHSYCMQNPDKMLFHVRAKFGGTVLVSDGKMEKLNTKTDSTVSALVYPSWHPSGRYVAFSVNNTMQSFHGNNLNRIEVYDGESDVVVYDVKNHTIVYSPLTKSPARFETFPTFSPDGKSLYFCSAQAVDSVAKNYKKVRYSLCRIAFNPRNMTFGNKVDTLFSADRNQKSASFPRVSPDGKYLVFTMHAYGNFSIWHRDADLYIVNMLTGSISPLKAANSNDVESYHSWSSNSRWLIFSSRRIDGLYTRLYISYIDRNGVAHKPFLLPQKNPKKFYGNLMFSYNIPEFMKGRVKTSEHAISQMLRNSKGIDVSVKGE